MKRSAGALTAIQPTCMPASFRAQSRAGGRSCQRSRVRDFVRLLIFEMQGGGVGVGHQGQASPIWPTLHRVAFKGHAVPALPINDLVPGETGTNNHTKRPPSNLAYLGFWYQRIASFCLTIGREAEGAGEGGRAGARRAMRDDHGLNC